MFFEPITYPDRRAVLSRKNKKLAQRRCRQDDALPFAVKVLDEFFNTIR